jgi:hypothetical protein
MNGKYSGPRALEGALGAMEYADVDFLDPATFDASSCINR